MKHSQESTPNYNRRRVGAAAFASVVALGGIAAAKEAAHLVDDAKANLHNEQLSDKFGNPGLARELPYRHDIDPADVTHYTIKGGDTPHSIAISLGATENTAPWVEKEIASQEGGQNHLQPKDEVVIPNEQLGGGPQG